MECYVKLVDIKQEFCGVGIKKGAFFEPMEEQSNIKEESGIKNDPTEEQEFFDVTQLQSFQENILVNLLRKKEFNNIDVNNDNDFIEEEQDIDCVWAEDDIKDEITNPLVLPEIKYDIRGGIKEESGIINDFEEEKTSLDATYVQSLKENILVNLIRKKEFNNMETNNDNDFVEEEQDIDCVWTEDGIKDEITNPLVLPEIKFDIRGGIKEESGIINDFEEEKTSLDATHVQSLKENILVNLIRKKEFNNMETNNDNDFVEEEKEFDYVWPEDDINETDPLALPEIKYKNEYQNIKEEETVAPVRLSESSSSEGDALSVEETGLTNVSAPEITILQPIMRATLTDGVTSSTIFLDPSQFASLDNGQLVISEEGLITPFSSSTTPQPFVDSTRHLAYTCSICGTPYNTERGLQIHSRKHKAPIRQLTEEERKQPSQLTHRASSVSLWDRISELKDVLHKPYQCKYCLERFVGHIDLFIHLRTHTGEGPFQCDVCNKCFTAKGSLKVHMRRHRKLNGLGLSYFGTVNASNILIQKLSPETVASVPTVHNNAINSPPEESIVRPVPDEEVVADILPPLQQDPGEKYEHKPLHPNQCKYCLQSFRKPFDLFIHVRTHPTRERPFQCDVCNKCFAIISTLYSHVKTHTNVTNCKIKIYKI